jgi:hypothetical protein
VCRYYGGLKEQGSGFLFVDLMDFGSMPGCGADKDKTAVTGAAGDDFVAEHTSVPLAGGLEEQ